MSKINKNENKNKVIIDASAFLKFIHQEEENNIVENILPNVIISVISITLIINELISKLNMTKEHIITIISLIPTIKEFTKEQAIESAFLNYKIQDIQLSHENTATITLAKQMNIPILTANKNLKLLEQELNIKVDTI